MELTFFTFCVKKSQKTCLCEANGDESGKKILSLFQDICSNRPNSALIPSA